MEKIDIEKIGTILGQFGGPISLKGNSEELGIISLSLIIYHKKRYQNINHYSSSEHFSLYYLLKYVIENLGDNRFSLITGLDLDKDGYRILNEVKRLINQ